MPPAGLCWSNGRVVRLKNRLWLLAGSPYRNVVRSLSGRDSSNWRCVGKVFGFLTLPTTYVTAGVTYDDYLGWDRSCTRVYKKYRRSGRYAADASWQRVQNISISGVFCVYDATITARIFGLVEGQVRPLQTISEVINPSQ